MRLTLTIPALMVLVGGCQWSEPAASSDVPVQTVTFYRQHPFDAELVSRLCIVRDRQNQRVLSDSAYEDWHRSEEWKRCSNALFVTETNELRKLF